MKKLLTSFTTEASGVGFSPAATDAPDLSKAASMVIVSPALGGCTAKPTLSASTTSKNVLLSFASSDVLPSAACNDFAKAIKSGGLTVDYTNVPYWNGKVAATVRVKLNP